MKPVDKVPPIVWQNDVLKLLDQRKLPGEVVYVNCDSFLAVFDSIRNMVVRGAPAIGVAAAYAIVFSVKQQVKNSATKWFDAVDADLTHLLTCRPTAVNLAWVINHMRNFLKVVEGNPVDRVTAEAVRIQRDDINANVAMGEVGAEYIQQKTGVLTHCNAGSLATAGFGTALGVIKTAYRQGKITQVFADETRPWLQGSRLTAWELQQDDVPVTVIADNAAAYLFAQGKVGWVIVGSDRIAANGDVANKIGTFQVAIAARYHGVKVMVVAPTTTIDMNTAEGGDIQIEQRSANEVLEVYGKRVAPTGINAWNPVFDITPADLIDVIVTEKGSIVKPNQEKIATLMQC